MRGYDETSGLLSAWREIMYQDLEEQTVTRLYRCKFRRKFDGIVIAVVMISSSDRIYQKLGHSVS